MEPMTFMFGKEDNMNMSITYIFSIDDFYAIHLAIGPHYLDLRKIYILSKAFTWS